MPLLKQSKIPLELKNSEVYEEYISRKLVRRYQHEILHLVLQLRLGNIDDLDFASELNKYEQYIEDDLNEIDRNWIEVEKNRRQIEDNPYIDDLS